MYIFVGERKFTRKVAQREQLERFSSRLFLPYLFLTTQETR